MIGFIFRRIVYTALVVLGATSLVFFLLHLAGDPLSALVPPGSSPEQEAMLRQHYGLDDSLPQQYYRFVSNAMQGDFGDSWIARRPAMEVVLERFPQTLILALAAMSVSLLIALPLGIVAGLKSGGVATWLLTGWSTFAQSVPAFWLGTLLVLVFAVHWRWLPSSGGEGWRSLLLPVIALAAFPIASISRLTRTSTAAVYGQDFVRTARGKGLPETAVALVHLLPNAILPVVALIGVQFAYLVGGSVAVEWVFAYPGVGQLALQSVSNRDVPVVLAFVTVMAVVIATTSLLVDLLAVLLDPRLRAGMAAASGGVVR